MEITKYNETKEKFELVCKGAENLSLTQNAGAAFEAVIVVKTLRELLTDEIMNEVFMPLMNTKIGFMTDRPQKRANRPDLPAYSLSEVRDAIIDAASFGLLPTFNQFNIIAEKMYPTKEGYTALLKKIGCKYIFNYGQDLTKPESKAAEISVKINYEYKGEKNSFLMVAVVPKTTYSSYDQLKGKAERRAKKMLYEYVTGIDLGDGDNENVEGKIESERNISDAQIISQDEKPNTVKI